MQALGNTFFDPLESLARSKREFGEFGGDLSALLILYFLCRPMQRTVVVDMRKERASRLLSR
jgi:hypothetical protein